MKNEHRAALCKPNILKTDKIQIKHFLNLKRKMAENCEKTEPPSHPRTICDHGLILQKFQNKIVFEEKNGLGRKRNQITYAWQKKLTAKYKKTKRTEKPVKWRRTSVVVSFETPTKASHESKVQVQMAICQMTSNFGPKKEEVKKCRNWWWKLRSPIMELQVSMNLMKFG